MSNIVKQYLTKVGPEQCNAGMLAYLSSLATISSVSPEISHFIVNELADQRSHLKLIASENYSSLAVQLAMGNLLTDKYAEGFPYHRFYAGCDNIDAIEALACEEAKKLFGCEHAYVQPHSGADANLIAFWAILHSRVGKPSLAEIGKEKLTDLTPDEWSKFRALLGNQRLLGMDYSAGGHLTHGYRYNVSAQMFEVHSYGVSRDTGLIDYDLLRKQAKVVRPLILLAGYSAYPRGLNFRLFREIADEVGAVLMVDMAHISGLVAGRVYTGDENPIPYAHIVTSTTHKSIRGPRGGMILSTNEFAEYVDKGCPLVIGGPLPQVMAAKAICFREANTSDFRAYAKKVVDNAKTLASSCLEAGLKVLTGGTENHLLLIDVSPLGITGRQAEGALRECGITLNRNSLPNDPNGAWFTSGLRIGTPAVTTLGMGATEMQEIASVIQLILNGTKPGQSAKGEVSKTKYEINSQVKEQARDRVKNLLSRYPVYPELDLEFLQANFVKKG